MVAGKKGGNGKVKRRKREWWLGRKGKRKVAGKRRRKTEVAERRTGKRKVAEKGREIEREK